MSKFPKFEKVNVSGFELTSYRSLLVREKEEILKARYYSFDNTLKIVKLKNRLAEILGLAEDQLKESLESVDIEKLSDDQRESFFDILAEIQSLQDVDKNSLDYVKRAIAIILDSRYGKEGLKADYSELKSAFNLELEKTELNNPTVSTFVKVVNCLPHSIYSDLANFASAEEEGVTIADYLAAASEKEEAANSPKA